MSTTQSTRKAEDDVTTAANRIAQDERFYLPLRVPSEAYFSDSGNPGKAVWATSLLSAYVERRLREGGFEVSVDDRGTGTSVSMRFGSVEDAVSYAVEELLYRGAHRALSRAPKSLCQTCTSYTCGTCPQNINQVPKR